MSAQRNPEVIYLEHARVRPPAPLVPSLTVPQAPLYQIAFEFLNARPQIFCACPTCAADKGCWS